MLHPLDHLSRLPPGDFTPVKVNSTSRHVGTLPVLLSCTDVALLQRSTANKPATVTQYQTEASDRSSVNGNKQVLVLFKGFCPSLTMLLLFVSPCLVEAEGRPCGNREGIDTQRSSAVRLQ